MYPIKSNEGVAKLTENNILAGNYIQKFRWSKDGKLCFKGRNIKSITFQRGEIWEEFKNLEENYKNYKETKSIF